MIAVTTATTVPSASVRAAAAAPVQLALLLWALTAILSPSLQPSH